MQQRVEVPGKEIVNSKTVISEGKLFASLLKKAWLMMENNSEESMEQMDLVAMGT